MTRPRATIITVGLACAAVSVGVSRPQAATAAEPRAAVVTAQTPARPDPLAGSPRVAPTATGLGAVGAEGGQQGRQEGEVRAGTHGKVVWRGEATGRARR